MFFQARLKSEKFATSLARQQVANNRGSRFFTFHFSFFPFFTLHFSLLFPTFAAKFVLHEDFSYRSKWFHRQFSLRGRTETGHGDMGWYASTFKQKMADRQTVEVCHARHDRPRAAKGTTLCLSARSGTMGCHHSCSWRDEVPETRGLRPAQLSMHAQPSFT